MINITKYPKLLSWYTICTLASVQTILLFKKKRKQKWKNIENYKQVAR